MSYLAQDQRYTIEVLNKEKHSQVAIAERSGKHKYFICTKLKRNCGVRNGSYRGSFAIVGVKKGIPIKTKIPFLQMI